MQENSRRTTYRLPSTRLYSLKKKNPIDKFYKLIAKIIDKNIDVDQKRIDVTQVVVHPDDAKTIRDIWRVWIAKDMSHWSKKYIDRSEAMNWLCYGPVESEDTSPGYFYIKELDKLFQDKSNSDW